MSYLICNKCEIYYEIDENFNLDNLDTCEICGNKLELYNSFDEYYNDKEPQRKIIKVGKGYAEKKSSKYNTMVIAGAVLGLVGLIGIIVTPFSLIILLFGAGLLFYGFNKNKSWDKGIKGESIVAEYLNLLPKDYFVFNDVKFPGSYGNLDHVVIGPTGIYVIEAKNYKGFFLVKDDEWFYKGGKNITKSMGQPGKQVIDNAMSLKNFFIANGVKMDGVWVSSIVTLVDNNFKIEQKPQKYNVLFPATIPEFIQNSNRRIDFNLLKDAIFLIEPYCIEISYIET